jgi:DNA recombination-dependent growth factor C
MGFAARSVSIMRYRIRGEVEGPFWEAVEHGVKTGAFKEVQADGDLVGMGWTSVEDFTDNQFERASYVRGNYVALSMRVDTVRVPARILEIHFREQSKSLIEQTGQRRLSSSQRRELKDRLKESLKQKVFPSIQVVDLMWNTSLGIVYLGTHAVRIRERVEDHFKKSFGLRLIPLIPYLRGDEILEDSSSRKLLEDLRPSVMAP